MRSAAARTLAAAGIAAPVVWAVAVIYCGVSRPGYDPVNQFISELAERGSSSELLMRAAGFYLPGLLVVMFGLLLLTRSTGWPVAVLIIIHGAGRLTAGMFPCDPGCPVHAASVSQTVHNASAMLNGVTLPVAALLSSFAHWKVGRRRFATYSLASAITGTAFLALMVMSLSTRSHVGLFQRLSFGFMNLWLAAFAVSIWPSRVSTRPNHAMEPPARTESH